MESSYYNLAIEKLDNYEKRTKQLFDRAKAIQSDYGLDAGQYAQTSRIPPFLYYKHREHSQSPTPKHTCRSVKSRMQR